MRVSVGQVTARRTYSNGNVLLVVAAPDIAAECRPGQFVMAAPEEGTSQAFPLLKRALAVYATEYPGFEDGTVITLLIKIEGDGTRRLSDLRAGDEVSLIGPLGNGFDIASARGRRCVLAAGGIGIASFFLLARALVGAGHPVTLVFGARTASDLVGLQDFESLGIPVIATTEDGSCGHKGLILEGLEAEAVCEPEVERILYVCGPTPMMRAVCAWGRERGHACRISVENRMACGFGVCLGCSVETSDGFRLACTHGPVFDSRGFVWPPLRGAGRGPAS